MTASNSRGRKIVAVLATALLAAFTLYRLQADEPAEVAAPRPTARSTAAAGEPSPAVRGTPLTSSAGARDRHSPASAPPPQASAPSRPTPAVVDLAAAAPSPSKPRPEGDEDRFLTNDWFTREDLQHPERYFERAVQIPELNRPEERRDTLAFFMAYREKLQRDLAAGGDDRGTRDETLAVIERYDAAIARLRMLIQSEAAE